MKDTWNRGANEFRRSQLKNYTHLLLPGLKLSPGHLAGKNKQFWRFWCGKTRDQKRLGPPGYHFIWVSLLSTKIFRNFKILNLKNDFRESFKIIIFHMNTTSKFKPKIICHFFQKFFTESPWIVSY